MKNSCNCKEEDALLPIKKNRLSKMQRKKDLRAMSIVKEKRDGVLKDRICADDRKKR